MKKLLLLMLSLFSVGALAGCNNSTPEGYTDKDDKFKEFDFVRKLDDDEKNALVDSVTINLKDLTTIIQEIEEVVDNDNKKSTNTSESRVDIYADPKYSNNVVEKIYGKIKDTSVENGVTLKDEYTNTTYVWDTTTTSTAEKRVLARRSEIVRGEKTKVDVDSFDFEISSKEIKKSLINSYLYSINDSDAYEDKDGDITFVTSSKKKTVNTVEYGDATRDEIKWEYTQKIYEIDEESRITKYISYTRTKTNRDEETKDWYSDIKVTASTYIECKYLYETRSNESIDSLNNSIKDHVSFDSITGYAFTGTATGTSRSADDITVNHTGESTDQKFRYIVKDSETNRVIEYNVHLDPYTGGPDNFTFSNVAIKFTAETRTGYQQKETSNHFINFNNKLPTELDDVIIKEVNNEDNTYYYLVNTSSKEVDLKIQMKLTATNYTINSIEIA